MTELDYTVPSADMNFGTLYYAMQLQKQYGWHDFLMPIGDAMAVISILMAGDGGDYLILESGGSQRWIWFSPDAIKYLVKNGWKINSVDANDADIMAIYWSILEDLGRDREGRKKNAANVAS